MARDSAWERLQQSDVKRKRFYEDQAKTRKKYSSSIKDQEEEAYRLVGEAVDSRHDEEESEPSSIMSMVTTLIVGVIGLAVLSTVLSSTTLTNSSFGSGFLLMDTILDFVPVLLAVGLLVMAFSFGTRGMRGR